MGLYNYVDYPSKCRKCGFPINDWQTKDDTIHDLALMSVPAEEVNEFYDICPKCGAWNQYQNINGKLVLLDCQYDVMEYTRCKNCEHNHEYSYDEDLKIGERLLAKKGYYMNCLLAKGLYFEKEPIELLEVSHD